MRTTITIPEELLKEAMELSGKKHYSDAIVTSLQDYLALRQRLKMLELLFENKSPHAFSKLKKSRKKGGWSP